MGRMGHYVCPMARAGTRAKGKMLGGRAGPTVARERREAGFEASPNAVAIAATLPAPEPGARLYSPELAATIVERMSAGETLRRIVAEPGMPSQQTFNAWVLAYEPLRKAWGIARKMKAGSLFEEALDLARDLKEGRKTVTPTEVNALRVAIETLKWSASKLDPGAYGDNLSKIPAIAIQINSTLDLGGGAVRPEDNIYTFKVTIPDAPAAPATAEPQRAGAHKRGARASGTEEGEADNG